MPPIVYHLRDYQEAALDAAINWVRYMPDRNGYVTAPGGSGKSVMIAKLAERCIDLGKRVIILARNEKLLRQNREKIAPQYEVGIYCAGLGEKDFDKPITVASIQSIARSGMELVAQLPQVIICDEAHNIHQDPQSETQYWDFFRAIGNPQIIGFTATNFRTGSGKLQWGEEIVNIPIAPLVEAKHLVAPKNKCSNTPDLSGVPIRMGEYAEGELENIFLEPEMLHRSVEAIIKYGSSRNHVLIFTVNRKHSSSLKLAMLYNGLNCEAVDGDTNKDDLQIILDNFQNPQHPLKYLINCNLLAEGTDIPCLDMVVILRSTMSKGLFEQMVYRGTRPYAGKEEFLLVDMGGNLAKHGALGSPVRDKKGREASKATGRICPECETFTPKLNARECSDCGYIFPEQDPHKVNHNLDPDTTSTTVYAGEVEIYEVTGVGYREHKSKAGNITLRVDYYCNTKYGAISEWYSPHHENEWARNKAQQFFSDRGHPLSSPINSYSMDDLLWHCQKLKQPVQIIVDHGDKFPRIKQYIYAVPSITDLLGDDEVVF
jgi:DNA repair protein RadD